MANHSSTISAISLALLFLSCLFKSFNAAGIGVYWGQNSTEGSILDACKTSNYKYLTIAFLSFEGDQPPHLNLSHCNPDLGGCTYLGAEIKGCQSLGIKVLIRLGSGRGRNYTLSSRDEDARKVAAYLWDNYLDGESSSRPLGDAVLDGIEFNIQGASSNLYWDILARALKEYNEQVVLAATPQCQSDKDLSVAIATGLFDYIWVKFYDNVRCQYPDQNIQFLVESSVEWSRKLSDNGLLFLNLPAAKEAAQSGYIPPDYLGSTVIPAIHKSISSKFGGVMLWNRFYDHANEYSDTIKPYIDNLPPTKPSFSMDM